MQINTFYRNYIKALKEYLNQKEVIIISLARKLLIKAITKIQYYKVRVLRKL